MGRDKLRSIVIEYDEVIQHNRAYGIKQRKAVFKRIISWTSKGGNTEWKIVKCPQNSFYGMKGYYGTLGLDVQFYNRTTNKFHRNLPN